MAKYVALLRGVNVGGARKLPMAELRTLLESIDLEDVQTYIQSGNVVFTAKKKVTPKRLEAAIAEQFGIEPAVVLRTPEDLRSVVEHNPFPKADTGQLHVGFMASEPPKKSVAGLDGGPFAPDEFVVRGTELYLHLPNGMGRTKLPPYLDRRLKVPTTYRNWRTITKLIELAAD